jgi:hypothetical protein
MAMGSQGEREHQGAGFGTALATVVVLMLTAGYVLFLYPGAVSKLGNGIALVRPHH